MSRGPDPIAALAAALDHLDTHVRVADRVAKRAEGNRLSMLHLHALAALFIGPLFAAIGREGMNTPIWVVARSFPGAPYTLGLLIFIGGLILGPATWYRVIRWEKVGLWILLTWYAIISISFGGAILLWLTTGMDTAKPSFYAPMVYLHLTAIMGVHLLTLQRMTARRRQ